MKTTSMLFLLAALCFLPLGAQAAPAGDTPGADIDFLVEGEIGEAEAVPVEPGDECQDHTDTTTICIGNVLCEAAGQWKYKQDDGTCPAGYTATAVGSVPSACAAAAQLTDPAQCNAAYCREADLKVERTKTISCCTVKETRICVPYDA